VQIVCLPSTRRDLAWFRHHYERVFAEGARGARDRLVAMEKVLLDNPWIGRPTHRPDVRRLLVPHTPFLLLYRVTDRIEILRLHDGRSLGGAPE
jgi:plasmid stabilization system protein ParE